MSSEPKSFISQWTPWEHFQSHISQWRHPHWPKTWGLQCGSLGLGWLAWSLSSFHCHSPSIRPGQQVQIELSFHLIFGHPELHQHKHPGLLLLYIFPIPGHWFLGELFFSLKTLCQVFYDPILPPPQMPCQGVGPRSAPPVPPSPQSGSCLPHLQCLLSISSPKPHFLPLGVAVLSPCFQPKGSPPWSQSGFPPLAIQVPPSRFPMSVAN